MQQLVIWHVGPQDYALPFAVVLQVVRAVAVTALPDAPPFVRGVVNVKGKTVPVIDLRKRFGLPDRAVAPTDHFIIVGTTQRMLVLWVDIVHGLVEYPDDTLNLIGALSSTGIVKLPDGLMLVHDLEKLLSVGNERIHTLAEVEQ